MLKKLLIIVVFLLGAIYSTCTAQWISTYGGPFRGDSFGENEAFAIALCSSGASCVAGFCQDGYNSAMCTIKYGANGDTLWVRPYQGNGNGENKAYAICVDAIGNIYVVGYSTDISGMKFTTIKYSSNGDSLWVQTYPHGGSSGENKAYAITVDPLGDVFVTGYGYSDSSGFDMVTIKYDSLGSEQWVRRYDRSGYDDKAYSIDITPNNDVVITGFSSTGSDSTTEDYTTIKYSNSGDLVWKKFYNGDGNGQDVAKKVLSDPLGYIYVTGYSMSASSGFDIITIKYNNDQMGDSLWTRRYDNLAHSDDIANSMTLAGSNGVIVTGSSMSSTNIGSEKYVTLYYAANGNLGWPNAKLYSGTGNKSVSYSVAVSQTDSLVYVTGASRHDTTESSTDMATVLYDLNTGEQIDSAIYNGPANNEDVAYDIKVDTTTGSAYVTGFSAFGSQYLMARLPSAIVTLKYGKGSFKKINKENNNIPRGFNLHQNYPNPFNPSTTIKFDIPKSASVKLVVYNILGQQIATLVNEYMKSGSYQIVFNRPQLSSGVYFYVLTADSFRDVKKMVLIK